MWILVVLVITTTNILTKAIDHYQTYDDCVQHKQQFEADFQQAYPGDADYLFGCVKVKVQSSGEDAHSESSQSGL